MPMEDESLGAALAALKGKDSELEQRIHTLEGRGDADGGREPRRCACGAQR
nr:MAG TPA: shock protein B [Caudoviricetes sp.]